MYSPGPDLWVPVSLALKKREEKGREYRRNDFVTNGE